MDAALAGSTPIPSVLARYFCASSISSSVTVSAVPFDSLIALIALALLTLFIVPLAVRYLRPLFYLTFDEDYARSQAIPATVVAYLMSVVIAVTIVLSIKIIGIVLLLSLLTIPTVVANALTKDYRKIALIASVVGVVANLAGFVLSYAYDLPTGSCIIFMLCITLISVKLLTLRK